MPTQPGAPPAPTVRSTSATHNSITVSWHAINGVYIFGFGIWQDGWQDRSTSYTSGTRENLEANTLYQLRLRALGDGASDSYLGWGSYTTFSVRTKLAPPPAPDNVRASVDLTNAQVTVSWDEVTGAASYKLERGHGDLGVQPTTVEWPNPTNPDHADRIITDMFVTNNNRVSRTINLATLGLSCGPDRVYSFRVSAYGNGDDYLEEYGPTEEATFGALTSSSSKSPSDATVKAPSKVNPLCTPAPVVDVIPLPRRIAQLPRRIRLRWDEIAGASSFDVRIAKSTVDFDTHSQEFCSSPRLKYKCDIRVDNVVGGEGLADVGAGEGFRIRVTVNFTDTSRANQYSEVIIVDSPIKSVNGDADDTLIYNGRFKVQWNEAGTATDNVQYTLRWRVLRPYEKVSGALLRHDNPDWHPTEWKSKDSGTPYDWTSKKTNALEYTIDHVLPERFMLITEEIYAFQLNYTINGTKYFSAHEAYGWTSNRAADEGELIATIPTTLRHKNKTYTYNICESTFSSDDIRQADWRKMIVHALSQWEIVTSSLVTMRLNVMSGGKSEPCTNYDPIIEIIEREIVATAETGLPIDTSQIREFVEGLSLHTNLARMDREMSEIKMVHVDESDDTYATSFNELADLVGFADCIIVNGANGCSSYRRSSPSISDIQIHGRHADIPPFIPPIVDDKCISGSDRQKRLYELFVHEAGHALGLLGEGGDSVEQQRLVHPKIVGSIMSYNRIRGEYCLPRPLDIMAIYAIYQTLP